MARRITITNGRILETRTIYSLFSPDVEVQVNSSADLLFPTATGKPYYQVGDMILTSTLPVKTLAVIFKEFEADSAFSWGRFLMAMMDADKVTVARRVEAIAGEGMNARITLRPLMKVTDSEWVQLTTKHGEQTYVQRADDLVQSYTSADLYDSLKFWIPVSTLMVDIVTIPLGSPVKSGLSALLKKLGPKAAKRLLKWGGRRLASEAGKKAAAAAGKIATGTAKDTAKAIAGKYQEQLRLDRIKGTNELKAKLPDIVLTALRDALAENVTDTLADIMVGLAPGSGAEELLTKPIKERITWMLAQRVAKNLLTPFTDTIEMMIKAMPVGGGDTYWRNFGSELDKKFSTWLTGERLGKEVESALKDIVAQPELVIPWD